MTLIEVLYFGLKARKNWPIPEGGGRLAPVLAPVIFPQHASHKLSLRPFYKKQGHDRQAAGAARKFHSVLNITLRLKAPLQQLGHVSRAGEDFASDAEPFLCSSHTPLNFRSALL